jgi:hypothetical protein
MNYSAEYLKKTVEEAELLRFCDVCVWLVCHTQLWRLCVACVSHANVTSVCGLCVTRNCDVCVWLVYHTQLWRLCVACVSHATVTSVCGLCITRNCDLQVQIHRIVARFDINTRIKNLLENNPICHENCMNINQKEEATKYSMLQIEEWVLTLCSFIL